MTIYSQHPSRGKVQILAAYQSPAGLTSATVTSVETTDDAAPIVDALNRVSTLATAPMSTWDERFEDIETYPAEHLEALLSPDSRAALLTGDHSLWYEYVKVLFHQALTDLDGATAPQPQTVRTAIATEVATEGQQLAAEWQRFTANVRPAEEGRRVWDFDSPTILYGATELTTRTRELLDRTDRTLPEPDLSSAVADLRLLARAHHRRSNRAAQLEPELLSISFDPESDDRHFVAVAAPLPFPGGRPDWQVQILHWIPDADDEAGETEAGERVLSCRLPAAPSIEEINGFLDLCGAQPELLAIWAKTPVGETLSGTPFVVSE
ncbi:hypothetical protein [Actinoplanes sp. NPDC049265]|uniref:hypothetical protein n=1 Tax=Actinoplanes sp. NPDC049265 TaxID=3363902 RepID=UPI0037204C08